MDISYNRREMYRGRCPVGLEILSIVPLQRTKRTPLRSNWPIMYLRLPSLFRPQAYIKASTVARIGNWHNIIVSEPYPRKDLN